jgi:hypothetical protein
MPSLWVWIGLISHPSSVASTLRSARFDLRDKILVMLAKILASDEDIAFARKFFDHPMRPGQAEKYRSNKPHVRHPPCELAVHKPFRAEAAIGQDSPQNVSAVAIRNHRRICTYKFTRFKSIWNEHLRFLGEGAGQRRPERFLGRSFGESARCADSALGMTTRARGVAAAARNSRMMCTYTKRGGGCSKRREIRRKGIGGKYPLRSE